MGRIWVHPLFWLAVPWFLATGQLRWFVVGFLAVLLHELSHAAMAELLGLTVQRVEIWPFGGIARIPGLEGQDPPVEAMVAVVGPLQNAVWATLATWIGPRAGVDPGWVAAFSRANLFIGLINLLPVWPLDGGHLAKLVLARRVGYRRAESWVQAGGRWLGLGLMAAALAEAALGHPSPSRLLFAGVLYWGALRHPRYGAVWAVRDLAARGAAFARRPLWPLDDFAVRDTAPLGLVLEAMRPLRYHRVAVVDENLHRLGILWEEDLWAGLRRWGPTVPVGRLLASR
ncbi:MAG: site-2 protease family protein [Firmicutes bacterium]|nr:M50 family metallopeptidase [Alicyclobacillaceae bacterium]MCL6496977.1 site-2 protease family protein [Bacillota bacterium]